MSPILLVAALVAVTMFSVAQQASAISKIGLDPDEFGGGEARYALEDTDDVEGARYAYVPVYYLDVAGTANAKPPDDMELKVYDFGDRSNKSMSVNVGGRISNGNTIGGTTSERFNKDDGEFAFTIPKANFTYRKDLKAWEASFITRMAPGEGRVQYKVQITNPSGGGSTTRGHTGKIGYSADNGQNFAVANRSRCDSLGASACGRYYDYKLPFGTPCSVTSNTAKFVKIYDGDNEKSSTDVGIQGKDYKFSVRVYDVTDGRYIDADMRKGSGDGNNETAYYDFTVEPLHKYELRINNVYTNNVLQFQLPYDSIESIVDCGYDVTPSVTLSDTIGEASTGTLSGQYFTTNPGPGMSEVNPWQVNRCIMPAGNTAYSRPIINNGATGTSTYTTLGGNCRSVFSGSEAADRSFLKGTARLAGNIPSEPMPALQPGQRVCFIFSVKHPTDESSDTAWRHSAPACVLIGKKPKVQILGNDLFVGRLSATATGAVPTSTIQTSISEGAKTYGSWVEYLASATGDITGIGTGSGYADGTTQSRCEASNLTLSNTNRFPSTTAPVVAAPAACGSTTTYGAYKTNNTMPNVSGYFLTTATTPTLSGNVDLGDKQGTYKGAATINITGGTIKRGQSVIINAPNSNVTISGNITYTNGAYTSIDDIPQVVIIARNIYINGKDDATAVTNIDSWLVASSTINTCNDVGAFSNLTTNVCRTKLTINGPVMTDTLLLRRTAGGGAGQLADAAEVINLRPDAYLWGLAQAAKSGRLQTTYETELPPRF